jgi:signal transduction histidine kinase
MGENQSQRDAELHAALKREESRCQAMIEMGRSLTAVHDLDQLLRLAVDLVTGLVEADRSTIFLMDRDHEQVWSKVAQGDNLREIRLPLGQGIAGWVAQTGKAVNLKDAYQDERFDPSTDRATGYRTSSMLCVPLRGKQGEVLGVIQTLNKKRGHFTVVDERLLDAIGSEISVAVENAQLMLSVLSKNIELVEAQEKLARKVEELDILFQLEKEISAAIGAEEMLERLLRKSVQLLSCEAGSILLISSDAGELIFTTAVGTRKDQVKHLRLPRGAGVAGWVAEHGQPALVNDPARDPRHLRQLEQDLQFPVRNLLAVPMVLGGQLIGTVEFLNKRQGDFGGDDEKLATVIAGQASSAIQLGRQREECDKASRLSSIGQMLSGVIHDFRTPMTIISGYVQLMAMEESGDKRKEQSEVVLRQFDFINDMTKELLAFARGESSLLLHKIYTHRFLKEMEELLTRELEVSGVKLQIEDHYSGPIRADENKLRRMVFNLTRNAREAMPAGGAFTLRVEEDGEAVRFEFRDTGPGIPEEIRGRLFQSFVTCGKQDGTGLGLAMVKKIVDEHQGRIEVDSPTSGGARFSVWLPKRLEP